MFCFVFFKNKQYTVYVPDKTKSVSASQDKDSLTVKMPENSYAADDRITAGYILTAEDDEGNLFSYEIGPEYFEKTFTVKKTDIYGKRGLFEEIRISIIRTLTIDFDKNNVNTTGTAAYQPADDNTLIMSGSGGSRRFDRFYRKFRL